MQLSRRWTLLAVTSLFGLTGTARGDGDANEQAARPAAPPLVLPDTPKRPASDPSPLNVHASSDVAGYADSDHVFVFTPSIAGRVENPITGWSVDATYLVDMISAASVDIVSTASHQYTELRQAGTLSGSYKPRDFGVSVNTSISREPDYLSVTAGGSVQQDFWEKNATLFLGVNYGHDIAGRTGTPFSVFSNILDLAAFKVGLTRIIDRSTIFSFIGDFVYENGDQSKPYRYIPLFRPGTYVPVGASVALVTSLRVAERPLEQLPLSRERYALSFRVAHRFKSKSTLRLDERLYTDSWQLKAGSSDARYLVDVGPRFEVGPHVRFHTQTPVDFWQRAYVFGPGFQYPALRTGDRELGPLTGVTGGFSIRWKLGPPVNTTAWVLGWDLSVMETHYWDDLYITDRLSTVTGLSLEADL
jgi:uncharacterized protein DUF3570